MLRFRSPNCHHVGRMIALIQRVTEASVTVSGERIGEIGPGLLALIGVRPTDDEQTAQRLLERLLAYRVFGDAEGRMNRSLTDIGGGLLLVPQFTLAADTRKGNRPGFSTLRHPSRRHGCSTTCVRSRAESIRRSRRPIRCRYEGGPRQ